MSLSELLGIKETPQIKKDDSEWKRPTINPFDFVRAIQQTGEELIVDEWSEKQYNAFIVNRAMSMGQDTVVAANEMNCRPHIPKKAQFAFLNAFTRKRKRYNTWVKAEVEEHLQLIQNYFGFDARKARAALRILNEAQIQEIKDHTRKGGIE